MQFHANLVKQNSSPLLNITLIGIGFFFISIVLWTLEVEDSISLFFTVVGILLVAVGGLLNRGKGLFEVDTEILTIDGDEIITSSFIILNIQVT